MPSNSTLLLSPDAPSAGGPAPATPEFPDSPMNRPRERFVTHSDLKTANGESYLEAACQRVLKADTEPLAKFLADVKAVQEGKSTRINCSFGNFTPGQWRRMTFVTPAILEQFEQAAREFYSKAHHDKTLGAFQKQVIKGFKLPDPDLDPDSYWLVGDRFNPRLVIWWGCEKLDSNKRPIPSIPLVEDAEFFKGEKNTVAEKLRARLISWHDILSENLELIIAKREPIGKFLARPVYNKERDAVLALSPLLLPETQIPISQCQPLKKIPRGQFSAFEAAAKSYYAKAHTDAETLKENPDISDYERDLRKNFLLPDVDVPNTSAKQVPDDMADFVTDGGKGSQAKAKGGPKEAAAIPSYWLYGATSKLLIMVDGGESKERCLCLTADEALNLPPGGSKAGSGAEEFGGQRGPLTIVDKLRKRIKTLVETCIKAGVAAAILLALAFVFFQYIYVPLKPLNAAVTDSEVLDPDFQRNIITVDFNAALDPASLVLSGNLKPGEQPGIMLEETGAGSGKFGINEAKPNAANPKEIVLYLTNSVPDMSSYSLVFHGLKPKFGRPVHDGFRLTVDTKDTRRPRLKFADASPENMKKVRIRFDKPIDESVARDTGQYAIDGMTLITATLKTSNTVVLTADKEFTLNKEYKLTVREGIMDTSPNKNHLVTTNLSFPYHNMPPQFDEDNGVLAAADQATVRVQFTKPVDPASATSPANYDFVGDKLSIGSVTMLSDGSGKVVELDLTNTYLVPRHNYTLHFKGVKDLTGLPGEDTSPSFPYKGTPVTDAPHLTTDRPTYKSSSIILSFNKPVMGPGISETASYKLEEALNTVTPEWNPSQLSFTIAHDDPKTIRLDLSSPLGTQYRYRLTWTNIMDHFGNVAAGSGLIVPNPMGPEKPDFQCSPISDTDGKRLGVKLIVLYASKLEDSSFDKSNFDIETAQKQVVPLDAANLEVLSNERRGTRWRAEIHLTWKAELPKEDLSVTWNHIKPQGEGFTAPLHEILVFKNKATQPAPPAQ
jgi:archaellum component FlaF (FlaF/FlaG flagellin family)